MVKCNGQKVWEGNYILWGGGKQPQPSSRRHVWTSSEPRENLVWTLSGIKGCSRPGICLNWMVMCQKLFNEQCPWKSAGVPDPKQIVAEFLDFPKKTQHSFPKRGRGEGGRSKTVWSFSENSSKSTNPIIPKCEIQYYYLILTFWEKMWDRILLSQTNIFAWKSEIKYTFISWNIISICTQKEK